VRNHVAGYSEADLGKLVWIGNDDGCWTAGVGSYEQDRGDGGYG
jgi:hypothetical protein